MSNSHRAVKVGFHSGELSVQQHAGVRAEAARLAPMLGRGELRSGVAAFLSGAPFAALAARDRAGRLWASPLFGPPGFLHAESSDTLRIGTALPDADPLHALADGQPAGLIVIDFATRRRVRINGTLTSTGTDGLALEVDQAYGNCPKYIQHRHLALAEPNTAATRIPLFRGDLLRPNDIRSIEAADTFFLGTTHPEAGVDASHRGGPAGFVRVTGTRLWWPDYPGNNMFNSFGNLSVDPSAALLFVDFAAGNVLQLSGTAAVRWDQPATRDEGHTGRVVEFTPAQVIATMVPGLAETDHTAYPHNPALAQLVSDNTDSCGVQAGG
jgi:predicted pyridoxine 5'-phosphate oxidase superfamily flavin-nucleotide-binding protein